MVTKPERRQAYLTGQVEVTFLPGYSERQETILVAHLKRSSVPVVQGEGCINLA